jgi:hypothetical protein
VVVPPKTYPVLTTEALRSRMAHEDLPPPPPPHTPLLNGFVSERVAVEELMAQEAGAVGSGASGLGV